MQRIYINPLPVRIWHWINAVGFLALIVTGLQIRYVGLIGLMSFETAVNLHNWIGFAVIGNYFLWLLFYLFSDKAASYHPELNPKRHFRDSFRQILYYGAGIFKGAPNPHHPSAYNKFNPLQRMLYQIIMLLIIPIQCVTGLLLWDVKRFAGAVEFFGGVRVVDTVHVLIFIFFMAFIFIHVYLASLGEKPTTHFKAMFTGYEETEKGPSGAGVPKAG
jgi:thiosulfate reductase cytochrome b subunit